MDNRNLTRGHGKLVGQESKVTKTGKTMFKPKFLVDGREKSYWSWDDFSLQLGKEAEFDWWTEESTTPGGKPFYKCRFPSVINPPPAGVPGFSVGGKGDEIVAKLDEILSLLRSTQTASAPTLPRDESIPF